MNFAVVFTAQQQIHLLYVQLFKTKRRYSVSRREKLLKQDLVAHIRKDQEFQEAE